jgi:hypothetical protein
MCLLKVTGSAASVITKNDNVIHLIADSKSRPVNRTRRFLGRTRSPVRSA